MNENIASLQFILIGTPVGSMAKRSAWFSTIAPRFILAGGKFHAATAENSIDLVRKPLEDYGEIRKIREVITIMARNFLPTRQTGMRNPRMLSANYWRKTRLNISWPASSTLRPIEKSKNGIILTRKAENYLMILTNF
jgi:hypothetical protein